jgi:hypothetical protein
MLKCFPVPECAAEPRRSQSWHRRSKRISRTVTSRTRCGCCSASPTTSGAPPALGELPSYEMSRQAPLTRVSTRRSPASPVLRLRGRHLRSGMGQRARPFRRALVVRRQQARVPRLHPRKHPGCVRSSRGVHRTRGLRSCLSVTWRRHSIFSSTCTPIRSRRPRRASFSKSSLGLCPIRKLSASPVWPELCVFLPHSPRPPRRGGRRRVDQTGPIKPRVRRPAERPRRRPQPRHDLRR